MLQQVMSLAASFTVLAAQEKEPNKFELSLTVLLTGLVIVFLVLVVLIGVVKLYGGIVHGALNKKKASKAADKLVPAAASKVVAAVPVPVAAPAVEEGIPGEIVAVIAAAAFEACGVPTAIKSIRRAPSASRSAWGMAGMVESTRPF